MVTGTLVLRQNEVVDSKFDFLPPISRSEYYDVEYRNFLSTSRKAVSKFCATDVFRQSNCPPLFYLEMRAGGTKRTFERQYRKLLETLGDMGGVFEIMVFIGSTFYCIFHDRFYKKYIRDIYLGQSREEIFQIFKKTSHNQLEARIDKIVEQQYEVKNILTLLASTQIFIDTFLKDYHKALVPMLILAKNTGDKKKEGKKLGIQEAFDVLKVEMKDSSGV